MEVILLEKIRNLGNLGDQVKVKAGYGRNYLIPHQKAVSATKENAVKFESRRAALEKAAAEVHAAATKRQEAVLALKKVIIRSTAGEEGRLFGSVSTRDIAEAITAAGVPVIKSEVHLPYGSYRMVGDYEVMIELHSDVTAMITVSIIAEA